MLFEPSLPAESVDFETFVREHETRISKFRGCAFWFSSPTDRQGCSRGRLGGCRRENPTAQGQRSALSSLGTLRPFGGQDQPEGLRGARQGQQVSGSVFSAGGFVLLPSGPAARPSGVECFFCFFCWPVLRFVTKVLLPLCTHRSFSNSVVVSPGFPFRVDPPSVPLSAPFHESLELSLLLSFSPSRLSMERSVLQGLVRYGASAFQSAIQASPRKACTRQTRRYCVALSA